MKMSATAIFMGSAKPGTCLVMALCIGLASCGVMEQFDHDNQVKPLPKVIDQAMADRLRHVNKQWYKG